MAMLASLTSAQKIGLISGAVVLSLSTFALVLLSNCAPRAAESCVASCVRFVKGKKAKKVKLPNKAGEANLEEKSLLELNATEIVPGVFLGGSPSSCKILLNHGIRSVLSIVEVGCSRGAWWACVCVGGWGGGGVGGGGGSAGVRARVCGCAVCAR